MFVVLRFIFAFLCACHSAAVPTRSAVHSGCQAVSNHGMLARQNYSGVQERLALLLYRSAFPSWFFFWHPPVRSAGGGVVVHNNNDDHPRREEHRAQNTTQKKTEDHRWSRESTLFTSGARQPESVACTLSISLSLCLSAAKTDSRL